MSELDLHGTRHEEVYRKLEAFLYKHIQIGSSEVRVITGNSPEMKNLVTNIVKEYNMIAKEEWGNFGVLLVNMK